MQDLNDEAVMKRIHDFNCEWLQRPNIAISEMAQTLRENMPLLRNSTAVLAPEFLEDLLSHFDPLSKTLSRLDNKDKSNNDPATRDDVVALLRTISTEPDFEECIAEGLNAAGALFMHLLVPLTLMRNPEEYAQKARRTPANQAFKESPTPKRMREFILNSITKKRRPVSGRSIWDMVEDEEEGESPARSSTRRGRTAASGRVATRRPLSSAWEEDQDGLSDETPEPVHTPAPSRRCPATGQSRGRTTSRTATAPPPSRGRKRPAPIPLASTPKKATRKRPPAAEVIDGGSSAVETDAEETAPLATCKSRKAASNPQPEPCAPTREKKSKAKSSSSSSWSESSSEGDSDTQKQPSKSIADKGQKAPPSFQKQHRQSAESGGQRKAHAAEDGGTA